MELCENNQQERCQLSECDVVKNFRLPPSTRENSDSQQAIVPSVVETIADAPIPFYSNEGEQSTAHRSPSYVHRHPSGSHPLVYDNDNKSIPPSRPGNQVIVEGGKCCYYFPLNLVFLVYRYHKYPRSK